MEEGQQVNKDIVKETEVNQDIVDENEKEDQEAVDENESYRKELAILLAQLESLKQDATNFSEGYVDSLESFEAATIYLGSIHKTLEKLESSHKNKVRKLKRAIHTANKEIVFLKNGLPAFKPLAQNSDLDDMASK